MDFDYEYDLYEVLQLNTLSQLPQIKQNYKKLALIYHPDKSHISQHSYSKIQQINEAYRILQNQDLRRQYDNYRLIKEEKKKNRNGFMNFTKDINQSRQIQCDQCGDLNHLSSQLIQMLQDEKIIIIECQSCNLQIEVTDSSI